MEIIRAKGHELGHHGYIHRNPANLEIDTERRMLQKGFDAFNKVLGIKPVGFRSPGGDFSPNSWALFKSLGFQWVSSLMKDDFNPYLLTDLFPDSQLVELPFSYEFDNAPYFLFL